MAALSDYLENKLIDALLRAQPFTMPATVHVGLLTTAPGDGTAGVEVSGGSYARQPVTSGLAAWAGTQGVGTVAASTGSTGQTSNNNTITFSPAPTANWGVVVAMGVYDAATAGNLLFYANLATSKTVNSGDAAPAFAAGALTFSLA